MLYGCPILKKNPESSSMISMFEVEYINPVQFLQGISLWQRWVPEKSGDDF